MRTAKKSANRVVSCLAGAAAWWAASCGGLTDHRPSPSDRARPPDRTASAAGHDDETPSAPGAAPRWERVADDVGVPSAVALASDRVVFTTRSTRVQGEPTDAGALFVSHKLTGPPLMISYGRVGSRYEALAVDATHAYVATSDARLFAVSLSGGVEVALADLPVAAAAIAVSATHLVYASEDGIIGRVPKDGVGAIEPLVTVAGRPRALSIDEGGAVYVATAATHADTGAIAKIAPGTREVTTLSTSSASPCAMVRDGRKLFWSATASIHHVSLDGGPASTVASGGFASCALAAYDEDVFFTTGAGLLRAPAGGGAPMRVADAKKALATAGAVAVDATHVYWLEPTAVLRTRK